MSSFISKIDTIRLSRNLISTVKLPTLYKNKNPTVVFIIRDIFDISEDNLKSDSVSTEYTIDKLNMKK